MPTFPFGAPVERMAVDLPDHEVSLFVLGAYPSAFHVRWTTPDGRRVAALPVDNEPRPFWDGSGGDDLFEQWRQAYFRPEWGWVAPSELNGSSGWKLYPEWIAPLGIGRDDYFVTDCLDTAMMSTGVERRVSPSGGQEAVYSQLAPSLGLPAVDMEPIRPRDTSSPWPGGTTPASRNSSRRPGPVPSSRSATRPHESSRTLPTSPSSAEAGSSRPPTSRCARSPSTGGPTSGTRSCTQQCVHRGQTPIAPGARYGITSDRDRTGLSDRDRTGLAPRGAHESLTRVGRPTARHPGRILSMLGIFPNPRRDARPDARLEAR